MKFNKRLLAILLIAFAVIISFHQYVYWGSWFELKDVHHELFISAFAFAGAILLVTSKWKWKK